MIMLKKLCENTEIFRQMSHFSIINSLKFSLVSTPLSEERGHVKEENIK